MGSQRAPSARDGVWTCEYNPLDKNAPQLPTRGQIKAVVPKECFERSYFWSMFYLFRDLSMAAGFVYATSQVLSTDLPKNTLLDVAVWLFGWSFYAVMMGTIMTGPWVLAHECGHGAFSPSQQFNDVIGFILHQFLLVPYFATQYAHAKHHRRTNHLTDGENHVPMTAQETGLGPKKERQRKHATRHERMGDDGFAAFRVWAHLFLGWPLYMLGIFSTGRLAYDGTPLNGRIADHFRPFSPMFPPKLSGKILLSTVTVILSIAGLCYLKYVYGILPVVLYYWGPYHFVNAWLVLYTWLHHSDPSIPHYSETEWTWMRGALGTIDRSYGIFDFFHHCIGSTHVVHHLFDEMPWYNAGVATDYVKAFLEPQGLYNYDPTPWYKELWRIAHTCHYVESTEGIQYYKSLESVPLSKSKLL